MAGSTDRLIVLGFLFMIVFQGTVIHAEFDDHEEIKTNILSESSSKAENDLSNVPSDSERDLVIDNPPSTCNADSCEKTDDNEVTQSTKVHSPEKSEVTGTTSESGQYSLFSFEAFLKPIIEELKDGFGSVDKSQNITASDNISDVEVKKNVTESNLGVLKNATEEGKKLKFHCDGKNITENSTSVVQIINSTELLKLLTFDKNHSISDCILVMFYAPWCQFSAKTAPSYNALARAFPQLHLTAVDAAQFSNLNARFGTVSVPNILLFHQSRAVMRYNNTDRSLEAMITFFSNFTGLQPNTSVTVEDIDYTGPIPSEPTDDVDYLLWLSWTFVIVFSIYVFTNSNYGQQSLNKIRILWQEHQHIE